MTELKCVFAASDQECAELNIRGHCVGNPAVAYLYQLVQELFGALKVLRHRPSREKRWTDVGKLRKLRILKHPSSKTLHYGLPGRMRHAPASYADDPRAGQLVRLFDAVAKEMPELPQVRASVEIVDRLRTTHLPRGVTRWPVDLKALPGVVEDGERLVRRLAKSYADASTRSRELTEKTNSSAAARTALI